MSKTERSQRGRTVAAPRTNNTMLIGAGAAALIIVIALIAGVVLFTRNNDSGAIDGIETFAAARGHSNDPVTYEQTPPTGGIHNPVWQNCGVYTQPLQNEYAVHSLEHGAVWITYQPDLPQEQVDQLRELVSSRSYALLSPYPDLSAPVVASAWGVQVKLDGASDPRLPRFIAQYMQGPQTPEPGAACSGGIATAAGQP